MRPGTFVKDTGRLEERFRIKRLLQSGKNYQVALAEDSHLESKRVCVKAIEYDTVHQSDAKYVEGRRDALRTELEFLSLPVHLLPEPIDWLEIGESPVDAPPEPVLVYEYQHGQTLYELVTGRFPNGLNPKRALRLFRELVAFAGELHERSWIFRDFDPRHVVVSDDDVMHIVGCGNAVKRGERMNVYKMNTSPRYTAPEIRQELSGKVVRTACDFYSLGCLFSFMLTGEEPTPIPEAPLTQAAYDTLRDESMPVGYRLLIARCLQPLAQKRFSKASELATFCELDNLPKPTSHGFGLLSLPAPWSGPKGALEAPASLSPGPLVSAKVDPSTRPPAGPPAGPPVGPPGEPPTSPAGGAGAPEDGAMQKAEGQELEKAQDASMKAVTVVVGFVVLVGVLFVLSVFGFFLFTFLGVL